MTGFALRVTGFCVQGDRLDVWGEGVAWVVDVIETLKQVQGDEVGIQR